MRIGDDDDSGRRSSASHGARVDAVTDAGLATLARWMLGGWEPVDAALATERIDALRRLAWAEGVTALVAHGLAGRADAAEVRAVFAGGMSLAAASELARRRRLRDVLTVLDAGSVDVLVLKGVALAHWLYPAPWLRESSDVDLLFASRREAERAALLLDVHGHVVPAPADRFQHELACHARDGGLALDMHWALSDWPMLDRLPAFAELAQAGLALPELATGARGLDAPHALLHACVHRASNLTAGLGDRLKWLYDLHLLAERLERDGGWPGWLALAERAGACGICAEGLEASMRTFATRVPKDVLRTLAARRGREPLDAARLADWRYIQWRNVRSLPWSRRLPWLRARLLPSLGHMRALYGGGHTPARLLLLRARRLFARLLG